jgi:small-conductance mechanosensitive channel
MRKAILFYIVLFWLYQSCPLLAQGNLPSRQDSIALADSIQQVLIEAKTDSIAAEAQRLQQMLDSLKTHSGVAQQREKARLDSLKQALLAQAQPVIFRKDTLFYVYEGLAGLSAAERAAQISRRIHELAHALNYNADSLHLREQDGFWEIYHLERFLLTITENDALAQNLSAKKVAEMHLLVIRSAIREYLDSKTLRDRVLEVVLALLALGVIYLLFRLTNRLFRWVRQRIYSRRHQLKGFYIGNYEAVTPERLLRILLFGKDAVKWAIHLLMLYLTLPIVFGLFPATRGIAELLLSYILDPVQRIFWGFIGYIPNLFTIVIVFIVTRYTVRFIGFLSQEIENEKLVIPGFYTDWARPTYNIIRTLLYAFMFVVIFPYLPGSDSPVFQGVSVFLGILFSLGSTSAISNIVAGLVITYMRPFKIGDRVKIGDILGDVREKNLLVTRIRTIKNEEITIPNANILSGHTINYTSSSQYIIHSTVTIGYDVPWRKVHEMLIEAAKRTQAVMKDPEPFVWQTSLDDWYVSYQINACTSYAKTIPETQSELNQHIQDVFFENGVEIMSPHYQTIRDGSAVCIPPQYLPKDYSPEAFAVKIQPDAGQSAAPED